MDPHLSYWGWKGECQCTPSLDRGDTCNSRLQGRQGSSRGLQRYPGSRGISGHQACIPRVRRHSPYPLVQNFFPSTSMTLSTSFAAHPSPRLVSISLRLRHLTTRGTGVVYLRKSSQSDYVFLLTARLYGSLPRQDQLGHFSGQQGPCRYAYSLL